MPNSLNPQGPHEHFYWPHHLERARYTAALRPVQPAVVMACVICGASNTLTSGSSADST